MFAPRAYIRAPLMRTKVVKVGLAEPSPPALTTAGSESLAVTQLAVRNPTDRFDSIDGRSAPAGVKAAVTVYSWCVPTPTGHHSVISSAAATRLTDTTALSPSAAGASVTACVVTAAADQEPRTVRLPWT